MEQQGRAPPARGGGLAAALAGVPLGAALQLQQARLWDGWAWLACGLAGLLLALWTQRRGCSGAARWLPTALLPWMLLASTALASFALTGARAHHYAQGALPPAWEGRDLVLTGVVAGLPQRSEAGQRFLFDIEAAEAGGEPVDVTGPVMLGWYAWPGRGGAAEAPPALQVGDRWRWRVRLRAPHGQVNPHGFDYELALWEQGVRATGAVQPTGAPVPQRLDATGRFPLERLRQRVRDAIFKQVVDPQRAGVVAALVLGDQRAIARSDWDVFRATGVAHLVSISGLHVTAFAWVAAALVGWGWRRSERLCLAWPAQHAALVGGLLLAAGYAAFSGWGVPAQRTVWMLAAVTGLRLSGAQWPWPLVWLAAMGVVVLADPWALLQPGFWMSFVAVGVLFASGRATSGRLVGLLREQAVVTIALAPMGLLLFGQVSLVGLPANLVAIPWVTAVVTPLGLAGIVFPPAWELAAWAVGALSMVLSWFASWPGAVWTSAMPPLPLAVGGLLGGLLLCVRLPAALRLLGLPLLMPVLLWQTPRPAPGSFEVLAADVGQGSAALVRTATRTLLYDTGPRWGPDSEAGSRVLVPLLRALDEPLVEVLVSHRDTDHIGGAAAVLAAWPEARLWSSIEAEHELSWLRTPRRCESDTHWEWDGVRFEFLHPAAADYDTPVARANARSCVLRISAGGVAALLAGDIEQAQERRLAVRAAPALPNEPSQPPPIALHADLLLVPHHGSRTSSSNSFLNAVSPRVAVVQAGWRNRFGHPAPDVVERYAEHGIPLVFTASCGAAGWSSERPGEVWCQRARVLRYWHHRPGPP